MLIDTKSLLAKLMATENIIVEQRNIPTAMFNVKDRILTVPIFSTEISSEQYDLFIGHEVGHALWTPIEGMVQGIKEKINSGILNVVEDSRIERKIKNKYPGLRNSFIKAYTQLHKDDFFGTKGVDVNSFNFIDRVNLFCKVGVSLGVKFNEQERDLLKQVETTETYDDVIEVSKRIIEFMKQQQKEKEEQNEKQKEESGYSEDEDGEMEYNLDFDGDYDEDEEENKSNSSQEGEVDDEDEEQEDPEESDSVSDQTETDGEDGEEQPTDDKSEEEIRSHTDEASSENQQKYNAENAVEYAYVNIPKVNPDDVIFGYKELYKHYRNMEKEHPYYFGIDHKLYQNLRRETNKVVSYLAKEFELRKNADQLKRASVAKTGDLNMSKIFSYQFSEDIFKKITVVPGGKSHGLVMFIDWSGSMVDHIYNTVKQLISLVMFCKKVSIPYEVYAFVDGTSTHTYSSEEKLGDLKIDGFSLLNLLSSKMSASEFNYAAGALVSVAFNPKNAPHFMRLGGTPLNEAIISALEIVPQFQKQNKLQMVNTVFLTDGDGQSINTHWDRDLEGKLIIKHISSRYYGKKSVIIRDPVTFEQQKVDNIFQCKDMTGAFVKLLKSRTNSNVLGFYVISGRQFNKSVYDFFPSGVDFESIKIKFRKEKSVVLKNAGFDEYYLLRSEGLDTEDDVGLEVKQNSSTRSLVSAFSKYAGGRVSNRVILNRFIGLIT